MKHLTDDQIQGYLDGALDKERDTVAAHLQTCPVCRKALIQYETLYQDLKDDTEFDLPADFASNVIAGMQEQSVSSKFLSSVWAYVAGLLITAAGICYFVDLTPLQKTMAGLWQGLNLDATVLSTASHFLTGLGVNSNLFFFAVLILLLYGALDRVIAVIRQGKIMLLA